MLMLQGFLILLCFQLLGELTVQVCHLFVPGPVMGMIYFFIVLRVYRPLLGTVEPIGKFITGHLALFFIPAGAGVIKYLGLFGTYGIRMILTIILSTTITMVSTALIFNYLLKHSNKSKAPHNG